LPQVGLFTWITNLAGKWRPGHMAAGIKYIQHADKNLELSTCQTNTQWNCKT
jgi:hypothetical protein